MKKRNKITDRILSSLLRRPMLFWSAFPLLIIASVLAKTTKEDGADTMESLSPDMAPFLAMGIRMSYLTSTLTGIAVIMIASIGKILFNRNRFH
jgi:hypothetical protein